FLFSNNLKGHSNNVNFKTSNTSDSLMILQRILNQFKQQVLVLTFMLIACKAFSQTEVEPWGNITGIRKGGQLFEFESAISVVGSNGRVKATGRERQQPRYKRNGDAQEINTRIDSLFFKEVVADVAAGKARVTLTMASHADADVRGVYFCIMLPGDFYKNGRA